MANTGVNATLEFGRDYQLPWKRGVGDESRKIWDRNGRLVCTMETSADSTFLVEVINSSATQRAKLDRIRERVERIMEGEHYGRVKKVAAWVLGVVQGG